MSVHTLLDPDHRQLLTALREHASHGACPTLDDLAASLDRPAATVRQQLQELAHAGWIRPVPGRHAIRVLNPADGRDT